MIIQALSRKVNYLYYFKMYVNFNILNKAVLPELLKAKDHFISPPILQKNPFP